MNIQLLKDLVVSKTARPMLVLSKYSPQIMLTVGVAGVVVSTVMACKATLKAEDILNDHQDNLIKVKSVKEQNLANYTQEDYQKDITTVYARSAVEFVKLYGPAVSLSLLSLGLIVGSHGIMQKRNTAVMAAYSLVANSFKQYRKRVVEAAGEGKDHEYRYGLKKEKITIQETDESGNSKSVKIEVNSLGKEDGEGLYSRYFSRDTSTQYNGIPGYDALFLQGQENYANDLLRVRGHVFLNEVYSMLGMEHTTAGALAGWIKDPMDGDGYISFGIFDPENNNYRGFMSGHLDKILLDFNVDGIIYDLI